MNSRDINNKNQENTNSHGPMTVHGLFDIYRININVYELPL